jgi:hypothetical protein
LGKALERNNMHARLTAALKKANDLHESNQFRLLWVNSLSHTKLNFKDASASFKTSLSAAFKKLRRANNQAEAIAACEEIFDLLKGFYANANSRLMVRHVPSPIFRLQELAERCCDFGLKEENDVAFPLLKAYIIYDV